jgi:ABC-type polysaccharide/polyol phosphate export permease
MVVAMGVIYAQLFHQEIASYLPFLTVGLIVWQLLNGMIAEGCDTFLREAAVIQQVPIPFSIHAYRNVCRNFIVLAHNLVIVPLGLAIFSIPITWDVLAIIPGLVWISILLGMVSTRFRDIPPIVGSFLQVLFFLTPIIWPPELLGRFHPIATFNPLFAAIDVVRAPLIGVPTAPSSWLMLVSVTVLGCGIAFAAFARFRSRIAYWI